MACFATELVKMLHPGAVMLPMLSTWMPGEAFAFSVRTQGLCACTPAVALAVMLGAETPMADSKTVLALLDSVTDTWDQFEATVTEIGVARVPIQVLPVTPWASESAAA